VTLPNSCAFLEMMSRNWNTPIASETVCVERQQITHDISIRNQSMHTKIYHLCSRCFIYNEFFFFHRQNNYSFIIDMIFSTCVLLHYRTTFMKRFNRIHQQIPLIMGLFIILMRTFVRLRMPRNGDISPRRFSITTPIL